MLNNVVVQYSSITARCMRSVPDSLVGAADIDSCVRRQALREEAGNLDTDQVRLAAFEFITVDRHHFATRFKQTLGTRRRGGGLGGGRSRG